MSNPTPNPVIEPTRWTTGAQIYTSIIARTTLHGTSQLAHRMHDLIEFTASSNVIDLGCGTGSLTIQIHDLSPGTPILATDIADGMLEEVEKLQLPSVKTQKVDGATLTGLQDDVFSHGASSFAIGFIPDPKRAVKSLYRVVKPGGVIGVAIWGEVEWADAVEISTKRLMPEYVYTLPEDPLAWRTEASHRAVLESVGLQNVRIETVKMPLAADGLDGALEYAFRGGNPVMQTMMSDFASQGGDLEDLERVYGEVLRERYPGGVAADGILGWGVKSV